MRSTNLAKSLIKKIPGTRKVLSWREAVELSQNPFLKSTPPGHFYSPIPDLGFIRKQSKKLFARDKTSCPGIELAERRQIDLVKKFSSYYSQMPFSEVKQEGYRYYFHNHFFCHGSSIILYSLMRHFQPKKIVEVGSGFSSAAMLDVNEHFFDGNIHFTFIEPYPERLYSLMTGEDREKCTIIADAAQHVPQNVFAELGSGDILFIDSSHVVKIGSDVLFLFSEILPILQNGVIVHIHDIYWPFEYPQEWVTGGRAWNEAYLVRAFLQFNAAFEILLFNSFLAIHHKDHMKENLPRFLQDSGSSLWIRRKRDSVFSEDSETPRAPSNAKRTITAHR